MKEIEKMTEEEIRKEIKLHKESIATGKVGTPNIHVRLADLERALEPKVCPNCGGDGQGDDNQPCPTCEGTGINPYYEKVEQIIGYNIAIALFDPHMKKLRSDTISYISPTTAKMRFAQAVDALMNRNWLVMNNDDITSSFETITQSELSPTAEDLEELHEQLEKKANEVYISRINESMEELINDYIEKKHVPDMKPSEDE